MSGKCKSPSTALWLAPLGVGRYIDCVRIGFITSAVLNWLARWTFGIQIYNDQEGQWRGGRIIHYDIACRPQRVQGLIALNAFGPQPLRQPVEDRLASIPIPCDGHHFTVTLDHEFTGGAFVIPLEDRHDGGFHLNRPV
jgi:hypothetical protein